MDVGIPMSLLTPLGEIVFNDLSGSAKSIAGTGAPVWPGPNVTSLFPYGLPEGNGYLMQFISGMHGAPVRNPVDVRPHKHGGIIHKFYSGAKYFVLDGLIVADTPEIRTVLYDYLSGWVHSVMQEDARFLFEPVGMPTRFITCRYYDTMDIQGPTGLPGSSPQGVGAPKQYVTQFVAVNPFAYTYTERDTTITTNAFVPNDGTLETWPVIEVYAGATELQSFTLDNGTYSINWTGVLGAGHYIEVDMFNETMYEDGNSTNRLGGLDDQSDFWSIPSGGCTINIVGADHIVVKSNDAWS